MKKKNFLVQFGIFASFLGWYAFKFYKKSALMSVSSEKNSPTQYKIHYLSKDRVNFKEEIRQLTDEIYECLRSDIPTSDIFKFNKHDTTPYILKTPYVHQILDVYKNVFFHSGGLYDPTLEYFLKKIKDRNEILSLKNKSTFKYQNLFWESLPFIGLDYVMTNPNRLKKLKREVCLKLDNTIPSCQNKNIAAFFQENDIKNFRSVFKNDAIVRGFSDPKAKTNWKVTYRFPLEVMDEGAKNPSIQNIKIVFSLTNKAIALINNAGDNYLENSYADDLKQFKSLTEERLSLQKRSKFIFFKHVQKTTPKLELVTPEVLALQEKLVEVKRDKRLLLKLDWETENYVYAPFKNYSVEKLSEALKEKVLEKVNLRKYYQSARAKMERDNLKEKLTKIFNGIIEEEKYKDLVHTVFVVDKEEQEEKPDEARRTQLKEVILKKRQNIFIDHHDGRIFTPDFVCAFVLSDDPILSKSLALSLTMNNFKNASELLEKFKDHQCSYFVLYQDEEENLRYKCSSELKVAIDNHKYFISL